MSRVCLALTAPTIGENQVLVDQYRNSIDLAEVRADFLTPHEWSGVDAIRTDLPLILTCRRSREGGQFTGSERERIQLLSGAVKSATGHGRPFAFLDLEDDVTAPELEEQLIQGHGRIIRSHHDPNSLPEDLAGRLERMRRRDTDIPKAAVMPRSTADLLRLFEIGRQTPFEKILIGMGDHGFATRILTAQMGSYLTFTSARTATEAAPGHIDPQQLRSLYRYDRITGSTAVFGVIGNPVMHSFSPHIHNRGYSMLDFDGVYLPFLVDRVADFMKLAEFLDIRGVSVTIPHKQTVIEHTQTRDPSVDIVGACNTLVRRSEGWYGTNTDVQGFLQPLRQVAGGRKGRRAAVIGAGGAARALVYGLKEDGWDVLILNRTANRAETLARAFNCRWAPLDNEGFKRLADHSDLIAQTTSAGMRPWEDLDPLEGYAFRGDEIVYDTIFNPPETRMLVRAREAGCITIRGGRMLLAQALHQFLLFTGRAYPDPDGVDIG